MSDTPEYILRKPIKAKTKPHSSEYVITELFFDLEHDAMHPRIFDEWFVLLDRQALTEQLLKLIEDHNDGLLFTASSCSDYFREEEARGLLSWAATKSEDGNSMNTFLAKEIMVLFGLENKETETE